MPSMGFYLTVFVDKYSNMCITLLVPACVIFVCVSVISNQSISKTDAICVKS